MEDSTKKLFVTYVDAFGDLLKIWGQQDRTCANYIEKQLMNLTTELNMMSIPSANCIQKGMLCYGKCSDGKYYRVKITSDVMNNNVTVYFIDYGYKERIDLSNLRLQNGSNVIGTIVSQADEFFLANVCAHGSWCQVLNDIKRDLCYKEFSYSIKYQDKNEKFIQINFYEENYSSALVRRNLAKFLSVNDQVLLLKYAFKNQEQNGISMNVPKSNQLPQHSNISSLPIQTQKRIQKSSVRTVAYNNIPGIGIKTQSALNSDFIEALADQLKQHLFKEPVNNYNTSETASHNYVTQVLGVGTTHSVYISYIDDGPWSFSIQLVSCEHELNHLMDQLAACELIPVKLPVVLGYPCIAKSREYGTICRGVVVNVSHSAVKIYFVDFGNTEDLPVSSIFELPVNFFKIKAMSQKFALSGLQKIKPSPEIKKAFNEVVENELLLLRVTTLEGENLPTCDLYLKNVNIKRILNEKVLQLRKWTPIRPPRDGDVENVVVTWIDSPQKFYVQLKKYDRELTDLKLELAQWGATGEYFNPNELAIGALGVCCFSGDNQWYRVIVTSIKSKDFATVFYVDYGNVEEVRQSAIKKIGGGLIRQLNTQAVKCCLHGFENRQADRESTRVLEALILEKELRLKVVYTDNDRIVVKLFDDDNDILSLLENRVPVKSYSNYGEKDSKEETFRNMGEKTEIGSRKNNVKNRSTPSQNMVEEKSWRKKDENSTKSDCGSENGWRLDENRKDNKDDKRQKSKRYGFSNNNNRKEHGYEPNWRSNETIEVKKEKRSQKGRGQNKAAESVMERARRAARETHERGMKMSGANFRYPVKLENMALSGSMFKTKNIPIGLVEEVIVTYFLNPNEIYVQLLSTKEDFKKTMDDIQVYYSTKLPVANYPKKGDLTVAKFKGDDVLYRASVTESCPLTVRYVDYGNEEVTERERLWPMDKRFLELETQAIKCSLPNLVPNGVDTWPVPEAIIDKIFEYETYSCKFLNYTNDVYEIELMISENGKNVRDELISVGYALSTEINKSEIKTGARESLKECASIDFNLMRNETYKVLISHVVDPKEFYIQLEQDVLSVIAEEVNKSSEAQKSIPSLDKNYVSSGGVYLANIDDVNWRRVKVVKNGETTATVQLIDYGPKLDVPYEQIKPIPDHLLEYTPQAVHCCLFNETEDEDCSPDFDEALKAYDKYFVFAYIQQVLGNRLIVTLYDMKGEKLDFLSNLNNAPTVIRPLSSVPIIKQGIKVIIPHITSPNEIYIQRLSDISHLEDLNSELFKCYSNGGEDPEPGSKICAAKSVIDESWYRARILMSAKDYVKVNYIDFGNSEKLPLNNIKQLKSEFLEQFAFCRKISLNLDYEIDEESKIINQLCETIMDKECIGYFVKSDDILYAELIVDDEAISDRLLSEKVKKKMDLFFGETETEELISETGEEIERSEGIVEKDFGVFISHVSSPNDFWIHHESISSELEIFQNNLQNICSIASSKKNVQIGDIVGAQFIDQLWYRVIIKKIEEKILVVQFLDYGNLLNIDYSGKEVVHLPEDIVKVAPFAVFCSLRGKWKETASLRFEDIITANQDPFTLIELEGENPKIVDLVKNGVSITGQLISEGYVVTNGDNQDDYDVYITHINSPSDFYIQRNGDKALFDTLISGLLEADMFDDVEDVKENQIYCAKFPENEMWYRAKVLKRNENDVYVHFIDYGNNCNVTDIKMLPMDYLEIPSLSLNCALRYGQVNDSWSEAACKKFTEYMNNSPFRMEIVFEGVQRTVVTLFTEDGENLTELLEKLCESDGREHVCITYNISPSDFYVQRVINTDYDLIVERLKEWKNFEKLEKIEIGMMCAAKFDDGMWYRGELKKISDDGDDDYEVYFIDYGNIALTKEIKSLPDDLKKIKPLAKNCCLNLPLKHIPESIKEEFFHLIGQSHLLRIRVIEPGDRDIVSVMLDGMKLEEVLLYTLSDAFDVEWESQRNVKTVSDHVTNLSGNVEIDVGVGNESDEEKNVKSTMEITERSQCNEEIVVKEIPVDETPDNDSPKEFSESQVNEEWIEETETVLNESAEGENETKIEIKEFENGSISECEADVLKNDKSVCESECTSESSKELSVDDDTNTTIKTTLETNNVEETEPVRGSRMSLDEKLVSAVVNGTTQGSPD